MAHKYRDPYSNKLKSSRHHNRWNQKKKLHDSLSTGADGRFPWPVVWSDYEQNDFNYQNHPAPGAYPKRNYRRQMSKYLKTQCHRRVRKKEVYNSTYNKATEYWWELG